MIWLPINANIIRFIISYDISILKCHYFFGVGVGILDSNTYSMWVYKELINYAKNISYYANDY